MSKKKEFNFMDSIYGALNAPEDNYDDGIIYLDEPEEEYGYEDELSWADDITYLDEPIEEDEFDYNLGEGYIPLPQGNVEEIPAVVIDENYVLDEHEIDIVEGVVYIDDEVEEIEEVIKDSEPKEVIDLDKAESIIKLPGEEEIPDELSVVNLSSEDDKISKAIAREHLENSSVDSTLIGDEYADASDDTSWIDNQDLFGNDIDVILAEDPNSDIEDDDYVDGSFEDWISQNEPMHI